MQEQDLLNRMETLEKKAQLLLRDYNHVKEALVKVKEENRQLKNVVSEQNKQLTDFSYRTKIDKIVETLEVNGQGSEDLKRTIDEYILKIDECITQLSNNL
jgi:predicted ribosome quality control (RQC) complex YloA/Tae2 family protein